MDPITQAVNQFQKNFREFKKNQDFQILHVSTESKNIGTLLKALRAQEWDIENQNPFLIFDRAYTHEDETFNAMKTALLDHYAILKEAFKEEGKELPDFGKISKVENPLAFFIAHLNRFVLCTQDFLKPPFFCWLPTDVQDNRGFQKSVTDLLRGAHSAGISHFVFSDELGKERLSPPFSNSKTILMKTTFEIDESGLMEYFKKMMSPPSKGRPPGTLPGVAAPDVIPPPRPGAPPPTNEQIKKALEESGLPPVLTPEEGERLRQFVMEAAIASGEKDKETTIRKQVAACELCKKAGVTLEHALMTLVLANYLLMFRQEDKAEDYYLRAEKLAGDAKAYPQLAQVRMSLGYLLLKNKRIDEAIHFYEQAAYAALIGKTNLLFFESLRMAGTYHLQRKREKEAYLCWRAAVSKGEDASLDELRVSSFLDIAGALIKLLKKNKLTEQAKSVEALILKSSEESKEDSKS